MTMWRVAVVVPAHNEAELLPGCLEAITLASTHPEVLGAVTRIVVVADACGDATAAVARGAGAQVVEVAHRKVGAARAAGVEAARDSGATWIATTDADSRVPADWLAQQRRYAMAGADVVVGTVSVASWSEWPETLPAVYDRSYSDGLSGGSHRHVHGANLGLRLGAYDAVGGFPAIGVAEDVALVAAAHDAGLTVVRPTTIAVQTSARRRARAHGGFARHLADLERTIM